jgi:hypothetical protein
VYSKLCVEMTSLVSWYLHWRGHWELRIRLCRRITDSAERGELAISSSTRTLIGNLYVDRGWVHLHQGDINAAAICADAGGKWILGRSGARLYCDAFGT